MLANSQAFSLALTYDSDAGLLPTRIMAILGLAIV
jgi:hypothetical protein